MEWPNGIRVAPPPALRRLERSYVRQLIRKIPDSTKLPWYASNPIAGWGQAAIHSGLDRGTVFGPVHAVSDARATHGLISVCVPPPLCCLPYDARDSLPSLIWVNVFTCRHRGRTVSHHFCEPVAASDIDQWRAHGWYDWWIPRSS